MMLLALISIDGRRMLLRPLRRAASPVFRQHLLVALALCWLWSQRKATGDNHCSHCISFIHATGRHLRQNIITIG